MPNASTSPDRAPTSRRLSRPIRLAGVSFVLLLAAGCTRVPVYDQARVSRPGMTFSSSLVETPQFNLLPQIEPGTAVSGGAKGAGCTACR